MAVGCHVVFVTPTRVNSITGAVVDIDSQTATLKDHMQTHTEPRVVVNAAVPSSATRPTIEQYLELEAAGNYVLGSLTQTMIVTYDSAAM